MQALHFQRTFCLPLGPRVNGRLCVARERTKLRGENGGETHTRRGCMHRAEKEKKMREMQGDVGVKVGLSQWIEAEGRGSLAGQLRILGDCCATFGARG